jgi:hypothetical protein
VNDFPSFLQGEEQQNTQHLVIKYLSNDPVKGKKPKSARKSKSDKADATPRLTTPRSARTNSINPIIRPYSRHSLSARETKEMKIQTARDLLAELRDIQTARQLEESETLEKRVQFGESTLDIPVQDLTIPRSISPILKRKSSVKSEKQNDDVGKRNGMSRKSPDSKSLQSNGTGSKLTPRTKGELRLDLAQLQNSSDEDEKESDEEDENSNKVSMNGEMKG